MYKVIVADDEQVIRNGVTSMINNEIDGFFCVESFRDGFEVIEYLQDNDVDVVISDIKMIDVSGIELSKYIYENKSHIKVILLSGYSDFEYAKAAVRYKVTDYILKPTDFDELKAVFDRIRKEFSDESAMIERRLFNERIQYLYSCIRYNEQSKAHQFINTLIEDIPRNTQQYIFDLYTTLYERLKNHSKILLSPFEADELFITADKDTLRIVSCNLFNDIFELFNGDNNEYNEYSEDIKKYIDNHFCEDISLQSVADAVALSPVYLSRYFKKNTGENFSDYILKLRMEKASQMLIENRRVTDVSIACGFSTPGYFAKVFKSYYNCTPKEFIRIHKKINQE